MSDEEHPTGDQAGSIDDPDWVDQIVARALAKAEGAVRAAALEADTDADPGTTSRSVAEVAADAATKIERERPAPRPAQPVAPTPRAAPPPRPAQPVAPAPSAAPPPRPAQPVAPTPSPNDADRPAPVVARPAPTAPPAETAATTVPQDAPPQAPGPTDASAAAAGEPATAALTEEAGPSGGASDVSVIDDLLVAGDDPADRLPSSEEGEAGEEDGDSGSGAMRSIVEWGAVIIGALVVAFLIKTFLLQAFFIPSGSMEPTLNIGDRVLVNKLAYDFHDVNRGDLVVFDRPQDEQGGVPDLIKRVIALSGETIQFRDGIIYVDNRRLDEPYQPPGYLTSGLSLTNAGAALCGGSDLCTVPEGHVFVMGDNRSDSRDSRFFGPIPEDAIVGRAFLRVWPLDNINFL